MKLTACFFGFVLAAATVLGAAVNAPLETVVGIARTDDNRLVVVTSARTLYNAAGGTYQTYLVSLYPATATPPLAVGQIATNILLGRVAVIGTRAYVCSQTNMRVLDISNPSAPAFVAVHNLGAWCYDVVADGNRLVVAHDTGVRVLDAGTMQTVTQWTGAGGFELAATDDAIYLSGANTVRRIAKSTMTQTASVTINGAGDIAVGNGLLWVAASGTGLFGLDRTTLSTRLQTSIIPSPGGVAANNTRLFVAGNPQVGLLDIRTPTTPVVVWREWVNGRSGNPLAVGESYWVHANNSLLQYGQFAAGGLVVTNTITTVVTNTVVQTVTNTIVQTVTNCLPSVTEKAARYDTIKTITQSPLPTP